MKVNTFMEFVDQQGELCKLKSGDSVVITSNDDAMCSGIVGNFTSTSLTVYQRLKPVKIPFCTIKEIEKIF